MDSVEVIKASRGAVLDVAPAKAGTMPRVVRSYSTNTSIQIFKQQVSELCSKAVIASASEAIHLLARHSGMVRKHQTRNLEIPGSMLRIAPE